MNRKVRIAYSDNRALFTPRGYTSFDNIPGFIRVKGATVSGVARNEFNKPGQFVFYPKGLNANVPYTPGA